jgi:hypothetical protein
MIETANIPALTIGRRYIFVWGGVTAPGLNAELVDIVNGWWLVTYASNSGPNAAMQTRLINPAYICNIGILDPDDELLYG